MDIGFLVDGSGSVGGNWRNELAFVKKLAREVGISRYGGHAAVTLFSTKARLMIKFNNYYSLRGFSRAVNKLPHWRQYTSIDKGLDVASNQMFQKSNGMRPAVAKTFVFITDGEQYPRRKVNYKALAAKFHKAKIRVIVIGVGNVNAAHLQELVKNPSDLYLARNFNVFRKASFIKNIAVCDGMLIYTI